MHALNVTYIEVSMYRTTILNLNPGERVLSVHGINEGRERKCPNNKRSC